LLSPRTIATSCPSDKEAFGNFKVHSPGREPENVFDPIGR